MNFAVKDVSEIANPSKVVVDTGPIMVAEDAADPQRAAGRGDGGLSRQKAPIT